MKILSFEAAAICGSRKHPYNPIHTHLIVSYKKSPGGVGAVKARYFTGMYQASG